MSLPRLVDSYPVADIIVTVPEEEAEHVTRLITAMLGMNRIGALVELCQRAGQAALTDTTDSQPDRVTASCPYRPEGVD